MSLESKQPFEGRSNEEDSEMLDEERERFPTGKEVSYGSIMIGDPDRPEDANYLGDERTILLQAYDKGGDQREEDEEDGINVFDITYPTQKMMATRGNTIISANRLINQL